MLLVSILLVATVFGPPSMALAKIPPDACQLLTAADYKEPVGAPHGQRDHGRRPRHADRDREADCRGRVERSDHDIT